MNGEAQFLRDSEVLKQIFDTLEREAFERAVSPRCEPETLRDLMAEVRTIRSVRRKLTLMTGETTPGADAVV